MSMESILSGKAPDKSKSNAKPKSKTAKVRVVYMGKKGSFKVHEGKLHRALGPDPKKPIPHDKLMEAMHSKDPEVRRMARSAMGLKAMHK